MKKQTKNPFYFEIETLPIPPVCTKKENSYVCVGGLCINNKMGKHDNKKSSKSDNIFIRFL